MSMTETMTQADRKRALRQTVAERNKALKALKAAVAAERAAYREHLEEVEGWPEWLWRAEEEAEHLEEYLADW